MALIKCKHCKKEISPNAKTCIHCGEPVEKVEIEEIVEPKEVKEPKKVAAVTAVEVVEMKDDGVKKCARLLKRAALILLILLSINTFISLVVRGLQTLEYSLYDFEDFINSMVIVVQNTITSIVHTIFYPSVLYGLSHIIKLLDKKGK